MEVQTEKRGRGRPKSSDKTSTKVKKASAASETKGRGRPKGAKNKPKASDILNFSGAAENSNVREEQSVSTEVRGGEAIETVVPIEVKITVIPGIPHRAQQ